jgi:hypothetical protein
MSRSSPKIRWLHPDEVYREARFETMLASLNAQLLSRQQRGVLRWVLDSFVAFSRRSSSRKSRRRRAGCWRYAVAMR